jgi:two-component system, cell cycle response regulator
MAEQAINGVSPDNEEKPVILIADDSRVVRVSLKNILKNDCQLIEAEDGQQAWELLLEHPDIRLIFSDLSMPRLDGRELLKKIRQSEINRIRNLPFIVVTGNEEDPDTRQELQDSGATEMVRKPFDPARIVSFVGTLVSRQEDESYFILPDEQDQSQFLAGIITQNEFMESASKELSFAIRNKNELAVALLKIDQFDTIYSHYSEPAVEHILTTTAEIIRQHIHPDDTMAYFGAGLYAILRPASNAIGTRYIGRRIIEDLTAKQFYLGETDETVSASIGISAPEIKHGTRLRELLLLAEGRLKAAMDLGGNRVIDKGNDTLMPVSALLDSSQDLGTPSALSGKSAYESGGSQRPEHGSATLTDPRQPYAETDLLEAQKQITRLDQRIDQLAGENKDLQAQVERWRKQSAESEQLRRRVFELESEQQQIQLKFSDLLAENAAIKERAERAEKENQALVNSEEERTEALKQSNQFYADENLRLEGQLDALNNRAQKAELAYRKSEQLILSLKDNIALLRNQLEQTQEQLSEARRAPPPAPPQPVPAPVIEAPPALTPDMRKATPAPSSEPADSDLIFDGFPSSETVQKVKAPVVSIFPAKTSVASTPPEPSPPLSTPESMDKPEISQLSIPVYRVEDHRPPLPKERRPLSSFSIAILILVTMLGLGGGLFYNYMQKTSGRVANMEAGGTSASMPQSDAQAAGGNGKRTRSAAAESLAPNERQQVISTLSSAMSVLPQNPASISDKAKIEAELTLRQMAEAAFSQQLQQINNGEKRQANPRPHSEQASIDESGAASVSADMADNATARTLDAAATETVISEGSAPTAVAPAPAR